MQKVVALLLLHQSEICLHRQTEELLNKRRNLLEKKVNEALEKTKEYQRAKNTRGGKAAVVIIGAQGITADHCVCAAALMSLKRKKAYEKQIEQIDNSISRVNEQQMMLENQRTTAETVLALQQGVRANKATMQVSVRSVLQSRAATMHYCATQQCGFNLDVYFNRCGGVLYAGVCSGHCIWSSLVSDVLP